MNELLSGIYALAGAIAGVVITERALRAERKLEREQRLEDAMSRFQTKGVIHPNIWEPELRSLAVRLRHTEPELAETVRVMASDYRTGKHVNARGGTPDRRLETARRAIREDMHKLATNWMNERARLNRK